MERLKYAFIFAVVLLAAASLPQSAGLQKNFSSTLSAGKSSVDKALGKGKRGGKVGGFVSYNYSVAGTKGIEVIYTKDLKKSVLCTVTFPDSHVDWKVLLEKLGLKAEGELSISPGDRGNIRRQITKLSNIPKGWVATARTYDLEKETYDALYATPRVSNPVFKPSETSAITLYDPKVNLP